MNDLKDLNVDIFTMTTFVLHFGIVSSQSFRFHKKLHYKFCLWSNYYMSEIVPFPFPQPAHQPAVKQRQGVDFPVVSGSSQIKKCFILKFVIQSVVAHALIPNTGEGETDRPL